MVNLGTEMPVLAETGQPFGAVAEARGVPVEQALNPKDQDSCAIKHNGPNPFYGKKRKASQSFDGQSQDSKPSDNAS
jgi:hypothetical protein